MLPLLFYESLIAKEHEFDVYVLMVEDELVIHILKAIRIVNELWLIFEFIADGVTRVRSIAVLVAFLRVYLIFLHSLIIACAVELQ